MWSALLQRDFRSRYLSADDFMLNKTAAGRLQDLADAAAVLAAKKANGEEAHHFPAEEQRG